MSGVFEVTWIGAKGVSLGPGRKEKEERWFDWASMDNVYAGHGDERSKVLCSVEFGLACVRRGDHAGAGVDAEGAEARGEPQAKTNGHAVSSVNGNGVMNGTIAEGALTRSLLLKPKVLLESVAEIL